MMINPLDDDWVLYRIPGGVALVIAVIAFIISAINGFSYGTAVGIVIIIVDLITIVIAVREVSKGGDPFLEIGVIAIGVLPLGLFVIQLLGGGYNNPEIVDFWLHSLLPQLIGIYFTHIYERNTMIPF